MDKKNSKEEKKSDRCFPECTVCMFLIRITHITYQRVIKLSHVSCCSSCQPSGEKLSVIYWPKPNFTHIWHLVRVKFGSCLSIFLFFDLFGNLSFLGKEFLCAVREKRAERYTLKHTLTNQAVRIPAKPKNAVCIFLGGQNNASHRVTYCMCAGKIDLLLGSVWHDVSSVKHTSPGHPGCNNRDIFLFCCFRFAVVGFDFCLSFFLSCFIGNTSSWPLATLVCFCWWSPCGVRKAKGSFPSTDWSDKER